MKRPELPLPQLHAFVVLAEKLHCGHAPARLGIAQPPLSQQIRRLEDRIGHALFTRAPGRVTLTPAGSEPTVINPTGISCTSTTHTR